MVTWAWKDATALNLLKSSITSSPNGVPVATRKAHTQNGVFRGITNFMPGYLTIVGVTRNARALMEQRGWTGNFAKDLVEDGHMFAVRDEVRLLAGHPEFDLPGPGVPDTAVSSGLRSTPCLVLQEVDVALHHPDQAVAAALGLGDPSVLGELLDPAGRHHDQLRCHVEGDVDVLRIEFDQTGTAPGAPCGNQGRSRTTEGVEHEVIGLGRVDDRPLHEGHGFHCGMGRTADRLIKKPDVTLVAGTAPVMRASRMKGIFMGGTPPYGYKPKDRKLVIDEEEARNTRWIFSRFVEIGSATKLAQEVAKKGIRTPRGNPISKNFLYRMLNNRAYIGEAVHKGTGYAGEHQRLIDQKTWERVHSILQQSPRVRANNTRTETPALLKGLLYGEDGAAFSPTHTRKGDRLYRYYVSQRVLKHGAGTCLVPRVPAAEIEAAVIGQLRAMLRAPEVVVATWKAARSEQADVSEAEVRDALVTLDPLWTQLFPAEQARIVQLLIERVEVGTDGLKIRFRDKGLAEMVTETVTVAAKAPRAAA